VADSEGSAIRRVPTDPDAEVTTVAGTSELPRGQSLFAFGDVDAAGPEARFQHPMCVAWHENSVYVADAYNHKIRKIDLATSVVETWMGTGKAGDSTDPVQFSEPSGLSVAGDWLFVADTNNHRICRVDLKTKAVSVLALSDLQPPTARRRSTPGLSKASQVNPQTVTSVDPLWIEVDLNIPDGYKLNDLAPITGSVFFHKRDDVIQPSELATGLTPSVADGKATFDIPATSSFNSAVLLIEVSYGYCKDEDSVCRLAEQVFRVLVTVADDAETDTVRMSFPDANIANPFELN
jgi:hypothetical protein